MKSRIFSRLLMFASSFALLLTACGGALPTQGSQQPDLSATLSELQGTVEVKNPEQADFSAATGGMHLQVQGQVRTGTDSRVRLDLSTGTIVRVAPESMFTLQSNEQQEGSLLTRLVIAAGQVWVILRGGQMEIETPSGVASVRGSYMSVWVDPLTDDVWVTCLEGWCQAENPAAVLDMVAGQGASLYYWDPAGTTPPPPPKLRYLSQEDIDQFLANNPEAQEVMNSVIATASALPTLAPTLTSTPVASCFELGLPVNGSEVPLNGLIQFDWNDQPDAYKYILNIIKPNGAQKSQIAWRSSAQVDPSELPLAGTYQWSVTAFDSNIQPICTSGPWTFTKPESPTPTPVANCFSLASPADGSALPETGPVTFTWAEQPGRYKYVITFTKPSGGEISLISWTNTYTKNMELLPEGGTYSWKVTAYDSTITPICSAGPRTFTKPGTAAPTPTSTPIPGSNPNTCVTLLTPADGTTYANAPRVDFTWTEYPGAYKYAIYFKPPATDAFSFIAWTPLHTRWIESLYFGGTYQWWVTVKDSALQDICTSPAFTFTKPDTWPATKTPVPGSGGNGLFWNQNGPTGLQSSCDSLYFSVSTNSPANSMVKVIYSIEKSVPDGNVDPHIVIGTGAGNFGGSLSLPNNGETVYWRFAAYNGTYTHDSNIYSFSCPSTSTSGGGDGSGNGSGGTDLYTNENVSLSGCTVSASADTNYAGGIKKFVISPSSNPPESPYIELGSSGGTSYSTSINLNDFLSISTIPSGSIFYWRFEIYDGGYILDSTIGSITVTQECTKMY